MVLVECGWFSVRSMGISIRLWPDRGGPHGHTRTRHAGDHDEAALHRPEGGEPLLGQAQDALDVDIEDGLEVLLGLVLHGGDPGIGRWVGMKLRRGGCFRLGSGWCGKRYVIVIWGRDNGNQRT